MNKTIKINIRYFQNKFNHSQRNNKVVKVRDGNDIFALAV